MISGFENLLARGKGSTEREDFWGSLIHNGFQIQKKVS
jgi:hypothetical protein